jgi:hypothetical protein
VPQETVQEPLSSFLAVRGIGPLLDRISLLNDLELTPVPDQAFIWSRSGLNTGTNSMNVPFLTYLAVPMNNATNVLRNFVGKYQQRFPDTHKIGKILPAHWFGDLTRVLTDRLPIVRPYVETSTETSGEFLVAGLFPVSQNTVETNPAPQELFNQFNSDTGIVFYNWEITQLRLKQLHPIAQIADMLKSNLRPENATSGAMPPAIYGGHEWLTASGEYLGNSVTEAKITSPDTIIVTRQSPVGLTAFELVRLFKVLINHGLLPVSK